MLERQERWQYYQVAIGVCDHTSQFGGVQSFNLLQVCLYSRNTKPLLHIGALGSRRRCRNRQSAHSPIQCDGGGHRPFPGISPIIDHQCTLLPAGRCIQQETGSLALERDLAPVGRQLHVTGERPSCGFDYQKIGASRGRNERAAITAMNLERPWHFPVVCEILKARTSTAGQGAAQRLSKSSIAARSAIFCLPAGREEWRSIALPLDACQSFSVISNHFALQYDRLRVNLIDLVPSDRNHGLRKG